MGGDAGTGGDCAGVSDDAHGASVRFAMVDTAGSQAGSLGFGVPEALLMGVFVLFGLAGAYFAVRFSLRMFRVVKLRRGAEPVVMREDLERAWKRCRQAFGVKDGDSGVEGSGRAGNGGALEACGDGARWIYGVVRGG